MPPPRLLVLCSLILSIVIFTNNVAGDGLSDDAYHLEQARRFLDEGPARSRIGYELLINTFSGFTGDHGVMAVTAVVLMSAAVLGKILATGSILGTLAPDSGSRGRWLWILFIAGPIANWWRFPEILPGQFTGNIWHNGTTVLSVPLILIAVRALLSPTGRWPLLGGACLAAGTLIKPNFAIAVVPAVILTLMGPRENRRALATVILPVTVLLALLYIVERQVAIPMKTIVSPMTAWNHNSPLPVVSLILSIGFPLAVTGFARNPSRMERATAFGWVTFVFALAPYVMMLEDNHRMWHGNFSWALVPATYLLFVVSLVEFERRRADGRYTMFGRRACSALLAAHVVSGLFLLARNVGGHGWLS